MDIFILNELHGASEAAFRAAYKKFNSNLALQVRTKEENTRNAPIANEARHATEDRVNALEQEILALKEALKTYECSPDSTELPGPFINLKENFAPENVLRGALNDVNSMQRMLEGKYSALYNNLHTLIAGWWGLKTKVLQHKKKLKHWESQLERKEFTLTLNGAPVTFRRVQEIPARSQKPMTSSLDGTSVQASFPKAYTSEIPHSAKLQRALPDTWNNDSRPTPRIEKEPTSQQPFHGHPEQSRSKFTLGHHSPGLEPSSNTVPPLPDVQSRKRKRVQQFPYAHFIKDEPQTLVPVKHEPMSSSPLPSPVHSLGPSLLSTQDLDDIGDTVQTPTKRRGGPGRHRHDATTGSDWSQIIEQPDSIDPYSRAANSNLKPVNANKPTLKSTGMEQRSSHRAALALAEDGDHEHNDDQSSENPSENMSALREAPTPPGKNDTNPIRNRLLGLLDGATTPSKSPFLAPEKQDAIRSKGRAPVQSSRTRNPLQPDENAPKVRPEDEPYRSWPLHQLGIDQFKINTDRNQGLDYAYDSVTRKKDERKCLSGCTRPGCCGDRFRAMARLGGPAANSTSEQAEEDQRILEEYVGDDREKLKQLSAHDRANLLVDARARVLANQHGRHRHSHHRAQSPPGFWRTDMPSTQEMESDREAAQRQERDKVEERYREAMRPGGLWKFADE